MRQTGSPRCVAPRASTRPADSENSSTNGSAPSGSTMRQAVGALRVQYRPGRQGICQRDPAGGGSFFGRRAGAHAVGALRVQYRPGRQGICQRDPAGGGSFFGRRAGGRVRYPSVRVIPPGAWVSPSRAAHRPACRRSRRKQGRVRYPSVRVIPPGAWVSPSRAAHRPACRRSRRQPGLRHGVTLPHGDGIVLQRVEVNRHTERGTDLSSQPGLRHGVTLPHGDGIVLQRVEVNRHTERGTDLTKGCKTARENQTRQHYARLKRRPSPHRLPGPAHILPKAARPPGKTKRASTTLASNAALARTVFQALRTNAVRRPFRPPRRTSKSPPPPERERPQLGGEDRHAGTPCADLFGRHVGRRSRRRRRSVNDHS